MRCYSLKQVRYISVLLIAAFIMPAVFASETNISIILGSNNIISEHFEFSYRNNIDTLEFSTGSEPISVIFDGDYYISKNETGYIVILQKNESTTAWNFDILYSDLIQINHDGKLFKTKFEKDTDRLQLSVKLPPGAIMADDPSVIPKPDEIVTDGKTIELKWQFQGDDDTQVAVFYRENGETNAWFFIIGFIAIITVGLILFYYSKKRISNVILSTLSENELLIVRTVMEGITKQKEITKKLNFSKSKISKIIRKLEEKGIAQKIPFYKTNKIKLKKIK